MLARSRSAAQRSHSTVRVPVSDKLVRMTQFGVQATGASRRPTTQASSPSPSDLAAEVARLRRENGQLRMERDILKKAALIFGAASR